MERLNRARSCFFGGSGDQQQPVRARGAGRGRQVAGAVERRRSGRRGGCGAKNDHKSRTKEHDALADRLEARDWRSGFFCPSSN